MITTEEDERTLVAALIVMSNPLSRADIIEHVMDEDFRSGTARDAFAFIRQNIDQPGDQLILTTRNAIMGRFRTTEDAAMWLAEGMLNDWLPGLCGSVELARAVHRDAQCRRIAGKSLKLSSEMGSPNVDPEAQVGHYVSELMAEIGGEVRADYSDAYTMLQEGLAQIGKQAVHQIGIQLIDEIADFAEAGAYVVIGGQRGTGKSSLARQIAYRQTVGGRNVLYYTAEDPPQLNMIALAAMLAGVEQWKVTRDRMTPDEARRMAAAGESIKAIRDRLKFCTMSSITTEQIALKVQTTPKPVTVVVDYLQILVPTEGRGDVEQVTHTSRQLRRIAMIDGVSLVVLSALSRGPDHRGDPEPFMADLRSSGQIESDATHVLLLWSEDEASNVCLMKLAKNRHGRTSGKVETMFLRDQGGRFADLSRREDDANSRIGG
jgi:replicative DNA helicase